MDNKKLCLSQNDSYKIWTYSNLQMIKSNYYKGHFIEKDFILSHESYTSKELYHISIQNSYTKNYDILDFRKFDLPYFNFIYLIKGDVEADYFMEGKSQYKIDEWALVNSKFNESAKSNIIYKKDSNMTFLHITLLEPILKYYMEFDTSFSKLIELELSQNSEKIIFMEGKYNPIIKNIVYSIFNNINKGVLGDKIIQIKVDELFLFILPQLMQEKIQVIDNIHNYIKGNFDKKITISQLSKLFKVSEYYIREGIKDKWNSTFSEYLKLVRLEKAYELYKSNKNLSYNQISKLIGYSNSSRLKNDLIEYESELKK